MIVSLYLCIVKIPYLSFQVVIAVLPGAQIQYFGVEGKTWKPLASTIPAIEATECYCAASAGNNLYVAGFKWDMGQHICRYNTEGNVWEKMPHLCDYTVIITNLCIVDDYMYAISLIAVNFLKGIAFLNVTGKLLLK